MRDEGSDKTDAPCVGKIEDAIAMYVHAHDCDGFRETLIQRWKQDHGEKFAASSSQSGLSWQAQLFRERHVATCLSDSHLYNHAM